MIQFTLEDKQQALSWYIQGIDIQTISDHYYISVETLKTLLHNV